MFETKKILFYPDTHTRKSPSFSNIKAKKSIFMPQEISSSFRKDFISTPGLRKVLPQTSLLINHRRFPRKPEVSSSLLHDSGTSPRSDCETESLTLQNNIRVLVTSKLATLLIEIVRIYKSCQIVTTDSTGQTYKHLFSADLKEIKSIFDITSEPEYLILSSKSKISETITKNFNKSTCRDDRPLFNCINMYDSVITTRKCNVKCYRSPLYVLKSSISQTKISKVPITPYSSEGFDNSPSQIFPFSQGRKVKQGAGGFKRPFLHFDKARSSISPSPSRQRIFENRKQSGSNSRTTIKEFSTYDSICIKYSLTKQEFVGLLSDFTYLKEKNAAPTVESISKAYNCELEVFRGIDPHFYNRKVMEWDEFVKFYVIFVMKRGTFADLWEFIMNFFGVAEGFQFNEMLFYKLLECGKLTHDKIRSVGDLLKTISHSNYTNIEAASKAQEAMISIYDLRIIFSLICKTLVNSINKL